MRLCLRKLYLLKLCSVTGALEVLRLVRSFQVEERDKTCRYFPPDFDPADLPRGQRAKDNAMKVRMMLPMTIRCKTCGEFMYKGTKFNCKKEDVVGENYLGLQIFRFYMHCRKCSAEITYTTDPQNHDYKMEHGATRNFEAVKHEQSIEEALKAKRAAEDEDKLKRIENKTADAKREMDMFEKLDDMLHVKGQHATVTTEAAIAALTARADDEARETGVGDLTGADEEALRLMVEGGKFTRRLDEDDDADRPPVTVIKRLAAPVARKQGVKVQPALKRRKPDSFPRTSVHAHHSAALGVRDGGLKQPKLACTEGQGPSPVAAVDGGAGKEKIEAENGSARDAVNGAASKAANGAAKGASTTGALGLGTYSSSSASDECS